MKQLNIKIIIPAIIGIVGLAVPTASGDIYTWTDENGVKYFTNYAPPKQATFFMKTPEIPYDEEADNRRRERDRLEVARQELAEREAFLEQQQLAAERRLAAAKARVEAALQEADRILHDAQAEAEESDSDRYSSSGYGIYFPYYGFGSRYLYKGYKRFDGNLYRKKHVKKHPVKPKHPLHGRFERRHSVRSHYSITRGRYSTHRSRTDAFRGRHGLW